MSNRSTSKPWVTTFFFLFAFFAVVSSISLSASLHFPEVLLDSRSFAISLATSHTFGVVLSFLSLLASGILFVFLSRALNPLLPQNRQKILYLFGLNAGIGLGIGAILSLILVPLWINNVVTGIAVLSWFTFIISQIIAPLLLAMWTIMVIQRFAIARVTGILGSIGLF